MGFPRRRTRLDVETMDDRKAVVCGGNRRLLQRAYSLRKPSPSFHHAAVSRPSWRPCCYSGGGRVRAYRSLAAPNGEGQCADFYSYYVSVYLFSRSRPLVLAPCLANVGPPFRLAFLLPRVLLRFRIARTPAAPSAKKAIKALRSLPRLETTTQTIARS